jgi:hypothetical protein
MARHQANDITRRIPVDKSPIPDFSSNGDTYLTTNV